MKWTQRLTADAEQGPLPALLLLLTVLTGVVDAVSILKLGRVFVANMTGNVVFIGFALAGAPGFSLSASVAALVGFLVGARGGGELAARIRGHRGWLLCAGAGVEAILLAAALVVAVAVGPSMGDATRDVLAGLAAVALGAQNAVVRRLGVSALTTTVLTMALTGIATDVRAGGWRAVELPVLAVLTMFAGAVGGAALVLHTSVAAGLAAATGITVLVVVAAAALSRRPAPWH
jgi:uncharacterized membrane protein YoaK (UPF0700 family)